MGDLIATCPCCGNEMPAGMPLQAIDLVECSPRERQVLRALAEAYPRTVSTARLINSLWGDDPNGGPLTARKAIGVHVCHLRKKLAPLGWAIRGVKAGERRLVPHRAGKVAH